MRPAITLALNWPASFGRLVVIPALPTFYQIYHEIMLEIGIGDRMIDLVQEGVDCVVRVGELSDSTLVAHPLPPLRQVTCGSTDYVARYCLPSKLEQLEGQRCVDYLSATTGKLQPLEFCVHGQVLLRTLPAWRSTMENLMWLPARLTSASSKSLITMSPVNWNTGA